MKFLSSCLVVWVLCLLAAGCSGDKAATTTQPTAAPTTQAPTPLPPDKHFSVSQLAGVYRPQLSFGPNFPKDKIADVQHTLGQSSLQLKSNGHFVLNYPKAIYEGLWETQGQDLRMFVKEQNGKSVVDIKNQMRAKGATQAQLNKIDAPAMFRISDDGTKLMSPTPTQDIVVILKKSS